MTEDDFDPSAAAARATGDMVDSDPSPSTSSTSSETTTDADQGDTDEGDSPTSSDKSITGMAMHTQPDIKPDDAKTQLGVEDAGAHGYIAVRKAADYLLDKAETAGEKGVPMILNAFQAVRHAVTDHRDRDGSDDEESDQEETADGGSQASGAGGAHVV